MVGEGVNTVVITENVEIVATKKAISAAVMIAHTLMTAALNGHLQSAHMLLSVQITIAVQGTAHQPTVDPPECTATRSGTSSTSPGARPAEQPEKLA